MASIKIKATKTMAKELNKSIPADSSIDYFEQGFRCPTNRNVMFEDYDIDYDNNGYLIIPVLYVIYKPECYAINGELTTYDLNKIFDDYSPQSLEEFKHLVYDKMEI